MININALGQTCPIPLIRTKKAIEELKGADIVEVLVDNEIAVQNLKKLASQLGCECESIEREKNVFAVTFDIKDVTAVAKTDSAEEICGIQVGTKTGTVVAIGSKTMGEGDEALGAILIKGFIFALTQMEELPETVLFYNGGAFLTCEGSDSIEDLKKLSDEGVKIMTCGTCLNNYGIADKLAVGEVTNMYAIVEAMTNAGKVLRP